MTYLEQLSADVYRTYGERGCQDLEIDDFSYINHFLTECRELYPEQDILTLEYTYNPKLIEGKDANPDIDLTQTENILNALSKGFYRECFNGLKMDILEKISVMETEPPSPMCDQKVLTVSDILCLNREQLLEIMYQIENYSLLYDLGFGSSGIDGSNYRQCYVGKGTNRYYLPVFCNETDYVTEDDVVYWSPRTEEVERV